jgi:hypothetical protein
MKKLSKIKTEPTNLDQQLEQLRQLKPEELRKRWKRYSVRIRRQKFVRR